MINDRFIPKGSLKVTDKKTGAVVYLYKSRDERPCAMGFGRRARKPSFRYAYRSEESRAQAIEKFFAGRRSREERKAEARARRNRPHNLEVGHILVSTWGYDQTNVNFYEVTRIIGKTMVELREIAQATSSTGWATGRAAPRLGDYIDDPICRKVSNGSIRINSSARARVWDGCPVSWTAYH